jgi:hypothetical protein
LSGAGAPIYAIDAELSQDGQGFIRELGSFRKMDEGDIG